jgi:hypothetical protein
MSVIPEPVEQFLERLRQTIREDLEIAADLAAIRDGTFVEAPDPQEGF